MLLKLINAGYRVIVALMTIVLIIVQSRLYLPTTAQAGPGKIGPEVPDQLRFVRGALDRGAGTEMQTLFPEGYFFSYVLYGLAWVDLGQSLAPNDPLRRTAISEARWAAEQLNTPAGLAPFSPALDPPFGVFAIGWRAWLQGGLLKLLAPEQRPAELVEQVVIDCGLLDAAFSRSATPFLSAYPNQAWPVDSVVAVAALRRCDTLFGVQHAPTVERWLSQAKTLLDPATGLLPHRVDPLTGQAIDGARGSSQSIIQRFLPAINTAWGLEQYQRFRELFVTTILGVPGIREYPIGQEGLGDVDSGPLLFGVSLSASAVTLGAARAWGDTTLAEPLRQTGEWLGMPIDWSGERRYAFGLVPVGDAFLVWSKTAPLWPATTNAPHFAAVVPTWWRFGAHIAGVALLALLWWPVLRRRTKS